MKTLFFEVAKTFAVFAVFFGVGFLATSILGWAGIALVAAGLLVWTVVRTLKSRAAEVEAVVIKEE